jgi:Protein-tyrosine-phosphatase
MIKIMFVCYGNICRSPMAEFVFKDLVWQRGLQEQFHIASSATSREEIGNPVHYGTKNKLKEYEIATDGKTAVQLIRSDYTKYNYIIGMEERNIKDMKKILGDDKENKIFRLLDLSARPRNIADPWYTGDFNTTYSDILEGCEKLLEYIMR